MAYKTAREQSIKLVLDTIKEAKRKEKMEEEFEIRERLSSLEREKQEYDFYYGESNISNDSRKRLMNNIQTRYHRK